MQRAVNDLPHPGHVGVVAQQEGDRLGADRLTRAHQGDDRERLADGVRVVARVEPAVDGKVREATRLDGALGRLQLRDEVEAKNGSFRHEEDAFAVSTDREHPIPRDGNWNDRLRGR